MSKKCCSLYIFITKSIILTETGSSNIKGNNFRVKTIFPERLKIKNFNKIKKSINTRYLYLNIILISNILYIFKCML